MVGALSGGRPRTIPLNVCREAVAFPRRLASLALFEVHYQATAGISLMDKLDSNEAQVFTLVRMKGFLRFGLCGLSSSLVPF